jgi:hypothetical protein
MLQALLELSSGELANRFTDDVQVGMPDATPGSAEVVANEAGYLSMGP